MATLATNLHGEQFKKYDCLGVIILSIFIPIALLYAAALNEISFIGKFAKKYVRALEIRKPVRCSHRHIYGGFNCGC